MRGAQRWRPSPLGRSALRMAPPHSALIGPESAVIFCRPADKQRFPGGLGQPVELTDVVPAVRGSVVAKTCHSRSHQRSTELLSSLVNVGPPHNVGGYEV